MSRTELQEIFATAKHRASPTLEWTKQVSRVHPYFIPTPTVNISGSNNAEPVPRRQPLSINLEHFPGRDASGYIPTSDTRDYNSITCLNDGVNRRCGIDIGRCAARDGPEHAQGCDSDTTMKKVKTSDGNINQYPFVEPLRRVGGVISRCEKHSSLTNLNKMVGSTSPISSPMTPTDRTKGKTNEILSTILKEKHTTSSLPRKTHHGVTTVSSSKLCRMKNNPFPSDIPMCQSKYKRVAEISIAHSCPYTNTVKTDGATLELNIKEGSVLPSAPSCNFGVSALRFREEKESDRYRRAFQRLPLQVAQPKRRITKGFAPMKFNHRNRLGDLLIQASADVQRAHSVMESLFGEA